MKENAAVLAFDFGASSGRAMLCRFDGEKIELEEVHRFLNEPATRGNTLYWNFDALFKEVLTGIKKAKEAGGFDSVGVDTWGVDFGLLDGNGKLLEAPVHYRDSRTNGLSDEVSSMIGERELYRMTGTQRMDINTLFQLYSLQKKRPELLKKAKSLLLMPDLFNYFLSGKKYAEQTIASTTQMLNPQNKEWNLPLLKKLKLPYGILPELIAPGTKVGLLCKDIRQRTGAPAVPVIAVASHDTASAVMAVPARERNFIFISCGTWSLFGTELQEPVIDENSQAFNLTNELGFGGTVTFLKNIIGLWLIQETRREFRRQGKEYSYAGMERLARQSRPFACFIDPDAQEFVPAGDIPGRIMDFCAKTGQYVPQNDGEIIRCIYESLAMKYRSAFEQIKFCSKADYDAIHMVGGGTKDSFLCQMTADAADIPVIAGPVEATALGNAAAQLTALGRLKNLDGARAAVSRSFSPTEYKPAKAQAWSQHYLDFRKIICDKI
jgi:rhamnulokinase